MSKISKKTFNSDIELKQRLRQNGKYTHDLSYEDRIYCKKDGYRQALTQIHKTQYMAHIRANMEQFPELEYEADEIEYEGHLTAKCWAITISPPQMTEDEFMKIRSTFETNVSRTSAYVQYLFLQPEESDTGRLHWHGHLLMRKNAGRHASEIKRDFQRKYPGPAQICVKPIYHKKEEEGWQAYIDPVRTICPIIIGSDPDYIKFLKQEEKAVEKANKNNLKKSKAIVPCPVAIKKPRVKIVFENATTVEPESLI